MCVLKLVYCEIEKNKTAINKTNNNKKTLKVDKSDKKDTKFIRKFIWSANNIDFFQEVKNIIQ